MSTPTLTPATTPAPKKFLSVDDVCDEVGVARRTIYSWWSDGLGPRRIKLPNGKVVVRADWLDDWMLGLEASARAPPRRSL
jgi:predicted DNA-binding transcriptional regulator AlpA